MVSLAPAGKVVYCGIIRTKIVGHDEKKIDCVYFAHIEQWEEEVLC